MKNKQDDLEQALVQQLAAGIKTLGLSVSNSVQAQLLDYLRLLSKWNRAYNLTAVRDLSEMLAKHLLDSLAIISWVDGQRILDVGSGAGFPGIPLAMYYPDKEFVLLDSVGKKTRFLQHVVQTLQLPNVTVVQQRVESYQAAQCFDNIVARAFSKMANVIQVSQHLCCPRGRFLLMKGVYPQEEITALASEYQPIEVKALNIPGLSAERHLVIINNSTTKMVDQN